MHTKSFQQRLLALASPVLTAILICSAVSLPLGAQTSGVGNITGTVTDSSGAAVSHTSVVVTDTDTGVSRSLTTNDAGEYSATFLQPGHYEVVLGGAPLEKSTAKI